MVKERLNNEACHSVIDSELNQVCKRDFKCTINCWLSLQLKL